MAHIWSSQPQHTNFDSFNSHLSQQEKQNCKLKASSEIITISTRNYNVDVRMELLII